MSFFIPYIVNKDYLQALIGFIIGPLIGEIVTDYDYNSAGSFWCFQSVVLVMGSFVQKIQFQNKILLYLGLTLIFIHNIILVRKIGKKKCIINKAFCNKS